MSVGANFQPLGPFIAHLMKCGYRRHRPVTNNDEFEIYPLDLTLLKLNVRWYIPFIIAKRLSGHTSVSPEQLEEILPAVEQQVQALRQDFGVLLIGGTLKYDETQLFQDLAGRRIAIFDRPSIDAVMNIGDAAEKARLISSRLVSFLGRDALSPYISGRPAIGGRFFGRSTTIKRLVPGTNNWTIIGNRRIGKTSLLKEIKERLKLQNEGIRTAEVYGGKSNSTQDAVYDILMALGQYWAADHVINDPRKVRNLPAYIHDIPKSDKREVAVFIDELDHILDFDAKQKFEFLHLLRETFGEHDSCRLYLAGFRRVMEERRSQESPLFNFTKPLELQLFSRDDSYDMIVKPLNHLGIDLSNSNLPEDIYRETGGHPELIQIYCAEILQLTEACGSVPDGTELLMTVFNSQEYKQKVLGAFLANTNPYEELLCYLLIQDAVHGENVSEYEFGPQDVNRVLEAVKINLGIRDITTIITHLKVSGIIAPVVGRLEKYRFSAPQLVGYCVSLDLDFCVTKALEAARNCSAKDLALWSDPGEPEPGRS